MSEDGFEVDLDGDGIADAVGFDMNGDGNIDTLVSEEDGGGVLLVADTDGDGVFETAAEDIDGDGTFESMGIDTDGDGSIDEIVDPTGYDQAEPIVPGTDPAVPDTGSPASAPVPTIVTSESLDPDQDGIIDGTVLGIDTDGDRVADITQLIVDEDGDGIVDATAAGIDLDGDGAIDVVTIDEDADGVAELVIADTDGSGGADTTWHDFDQDGLPDAVEIDVDEDGHIDVIELPGESLILDESGHVVDIETHDAVLDDPFPDEEQSDPLPDDGLIDGSDVPDDVLDHPLLDPDHESSEDGQVWFQQSENGFCAPASVAFIVAEYADETLDEDDFVERAMDLGYLTPTEDGYDGLTTAQIESLLESFGVEAHTETGTVESLDTYIDHGYNAIVAIDADKVWYGGEDDPRADGVDQMNHAVVVSDIRDGYVYLLDPGVEDGALERVPVEVFEEAWATSDNTMVVTDDPDADGGDPSVGPDRFDVPDRDISDAETDGWGAAANPAVFGTDDVEAATILDGADGPSGVGLDDDSWVERFSGSPGAVLVPVLITGAAVRAWYARHK